VGPAQPESSYVEEGVASWYGLAFHGRRTASGERFDMNAFTAAHPSLPFGTRVRVRNPHNGRTVTVRINDRGPHVAGRIIDLSHAAARALGLLGFGTKAVVITLAEPSAETGRSVE
jgi:rare lipoprotein A